MNWKAIFGMKFNLMYIIIKYRFFLVLCQCVMYTENTGNTVLIASSLHGQEQDELK